MKNNSVADFVAAAMDTVLKSEAHQSLFGTMTKRASLKKLAEAVWCPKCRDVKEPDMTGACPTCGGPLPKQEQAKADDNAAKDMSLETSDADTCMADDSVDDSDSSYADDTAEEKVSSAYSVAIDSLLTASAALDSVGMDKTSALSLRLCSLVVEAAAKKKDKGSKEKAKKDSDAKKKKESDAKEKAKKESDSKKKKESDAKEKAKKESDAKKKKESDSKKKSSK